MTSMSLLRHLPLFFKIAIAALAKSVRQSKVGKMFYVTKHFFLTLICLPPNLPFNIIFIQMTSTWRSKINAYNIIQRNLIRQIYKYTIKKYIQIHNKECTEISPRDSCFAQWGSSDESRDHCAAKIQHIDIPRQYESQLRQQSTRKHRMVNDVAPFLKHAVIQNYKEFCRSQALWGRQSRRA